MLTRSPFRCSVFPDLSHLFSSSVSSGLSSILTAARLSKKFENKSLIFERTAREYSRMFFDTSPRRCSGPTPRA
jgi:hypothetical protein